MQLGMVGLGRMGANLVRRLMRNGHRCVVFNRTRGPVDALAREGAIASDSLKDLVSKLEKPRAVWVMLPAGAITHATIVELADLLEKGDTLIDGGNSFFQDDVRHAELLNAKGIRYLDVGTSGGIWGLERGYCMMLGGDREAADHLDPIFAALAPGRGTIDATPGRTGRDPRVEQGYLYCGPAGSGHFVKMVHNGIEYGLMQAFAEGFDILRNVNSQAVPENRRYKLELPDVAEVWRRGSVVSSWLLDLTAIALAEDPDLREFSAAPSRSVQNTAAPSRASASAAAPPMPPPAPAISATLPATRPMPPSCHAVLALLP